MTSDKRLSDTDTTALQQAGAHRREADSALKRVVLEILTRDAGSVRDIATHAGLSTNTVSRWKRGE